MCTLTLPADLNLGLVDYLNSVSQKCSTFTGYLNTFVFSVPMFHNFEEAIWLRLSQPGIDKISFFIGHEVLNIVILNLFNDSFKHFTKSRRYFPQTT